MSSEDKGNTGNKGKVFALPTAVDAAAQRRADFATEMRRLTEDLITRSDAGNNIGVILVAKNDFGFEVSAVNLTSNDAVIALLARATQSAISRASYPDDE